MRSRLFALALVLTAGASFAQTVSYQTENVLNSSVLDDGDDFNKFYYHANGDWWGFSTTNRKLYIIKKVLINS